MTFFVLESLKVKGPQGEAVIPAGQVVNLPRETAIRLLNEGKVTPIERTAYKIFSNVLQAHLWLVPDEDGAKALRDTLNPSEAIYTGDEVKALKPLPKEALKLVNEAKITFPGSIVRQVKEANEKD